MWLLILQKSWNLGLDRVQKSRHMIKIIFAWAQDKRSMWLKRLLMKFVMLSGESSYLLGSNFDYDGVDKGNSVCT
ncbi:hypothetical protein AKJ16_DCAP25134 [Drosera capensis]